MIFLKDFDPASIRSKLIPIKIEPDTTELSPNQQKVLAYLIKCADILNRVFSLQKYKDNLKLREEIMESGDKRAIQFYKLMNGPFDEFTNHSYIRGVKKRNCRAGFYPGRLTKEEWDEFLEKNPEHKDEFISPYTIITRENGNLKAVPYSDYYSEHLKEAAELLFEATEYVDNYYLKSYLTSQANAFLNNDFEEADIRWIQLSENDIEPLLGAHELYEDRFLGYKAAFTAFIGFHNKEEFKKLDAISRTLDILQENLPIPAHYKKNKRGSTSQILIVDLIYCAGDGRGCLTTAAFNLPNSQKIRARFGSKKVLLHNIIKAKYECIMPLLAGRLFTEKDMTKMTFDAYFNLILLHEISHELGIGMLKDTDGTLYNISYYLKDLYSIIEEAKADVMGVFFLFFLIKRCIIVDCNFIEACTTYLVSLMRSLRFGSENAHGIAGIIQWNFLLKEGVIIAGGENKKLSIDFHKFEKSIEKLLTIILTLQGEGNYEKSKEFIDEFSQIEGQLKDYLTDFEELPIDIMPWFPIAGEEEPIF